MALYHFGAFSFYFHNIFDFWHQERFLEEKGRSQLSWSLNEIEIYEVAKSYERGKRKEKNA